MASKTATKWTPTHCMVCGCQLREGEYDVCQPCAELGAEAEGEL